MTTKYVPSKHVVSGKTKKITSFPTKIFLNELMPSPPRVHFITARILSRRIFFYLSSTGHYDGTPVSRENLWKYEAKKKKFYVFRKFENDYNIILRVGAYLKKTRGFRLSVVICWVLLKIVFLLNIFIFSASFHPDNRVKLP